MFATHDQENLVSMHQTAATAKQQQNARPLQPKTPVRYPKTPVRVPLNDENNTRAFGGGKSVLGTSKPKVNRSAFVTPANQTRTGRAVLGDKTTNAKARHNQHPTAGKQQLSATGRKRPYIPVKADSSSKLQILPDHTDPLSAAPIEVDTNPEPPPEAPYESEVWPAGVITFDAAKPANRLKGYYDWYHNRRDENGETRVEREMKTRQEQRFRDAEALLQREIEGMTFDLGLEESPKKKEPAVLAPQDPNKKVAPVRPAPAQKSAPSTLNSRRAAAALSMPPPPKAVPNTQRGSKKLLPSYMQPTQARNPSTTTLASRPKQQLPPSATAAGLAASRSTLGYNKGRTALSALHGGRSASSTHDASRPAPGSRAFTRSETTASDTSTITPESYAAEAEVRKPGFLSMFDVPTDEEADASLFGNGADVIEGLFGSEAEEEEEEFQLDMHRDLCEEV